MAKTDKKSIIIKSIITISSAAIIVALGLGFYFNRQKIFDFISANTFQASAEIENIKQKLNLTSDAQTIFYATHPTLDNQDDFNEHCDSHDEEISILGCYKNGNIHIYNIKETDLNGIIESTAAHELLHAVWERLGSTEKSEIAKELVNVYNDSKYHSLLADDLEIYSDENRIDELHSRIGTEIADLPAALEAHYAKYFSNQDLVVDFYNSYIAPFKELSDEIENLAAELEGLSQTIDQKTQEYYRMAEELAAKIDEFNNCAKTLSCFASEALFYAQRNILLAEQAALDAMYEALSTLIEQYNALVEEYNGNILRSEALEKIINSNMQTETIN